MSNIHSASARHGVDDEFDYGSPQRCQLCWRRARDRFFDPARPRRRGVTLVSLYTDLFVKAHSDGTRHR